LATGRGLVTVGLGLAQLLLALVELVAGNRQRGVQLGHTFLPGAALHDNQIRGFKQHVLGRVESRGVGQRLQACGTGFECEKFGAVLAQRGSKAGGIDAQQRFTRFYVLAFAYQNLLHHTAVQALHDLHLTRRHDLAFAAHDFIYLGQIRPGQQAHHGNERQPQ